MAYEYSANIYIQPSFQNYSNNSNPIKTHYAAAPIRGLWVEGNNKISFWQNNTSLSLFSPYWVVGRWKCNVMTLFDRAYEGKKKTFPKSKLGPIAFKKVAFLEASCSCSRENKKNRGPKGFGTSPRWCCVDSFWPIRLASRNPMSDLGAGVDKIR